MLILSLSACGDRNESDTSAQKPSADATDQVIRATTGGTASQSAKAKSTKRWYTAERLQRGGAVFAENCAVCHGKNAEGTFDWRRRDPSGNFPPPPLDGTAHAWHHPMSMLGSQIKFGAREGQGTMPGFAEKLSDEQITNAIAWFQDEWPDEIYAKWLDIEMRARSTVQ
jgi:mono/diheme cytochrome c family protein